MLENLILEEHNITKALELVHDDELLPVFIPSYKNRKGCMIDRLDQIPGKVHLFLYDDDRHNYPENFPENVTVHLIHKTENWCGLASKREYMLEWKKANGIHKCIEIDDDLDFKIDYPIEMGKPNKIGECSLWDMLRLYTRLLEPYGNSFGVAGFCDKNIRSYKWTDIIKSHAKILSQCIIQNVGALKEKDVHYIDEVKGGEDVQICMECALKGLDVLSLEFIDSAKFTIKVGGKNTVANTKEIGNNFSIYFYKKYKGFATMYPNHKKERLWVNLNWKKILSNDNSYDKKLMDACEEKDFNKIFEVLGKPLIQKPKVEFKDKINLFPVCIPTYKNRKIAELLEHVNEIEGPVYIFKYEDDDYSNRNFGSNVTIINISEKDFKEQNLEWRGITPKRRFIQEYMNKHGIDFYFMLDDDIKNFEINDGPNKSKKISINEGLKIMQEHFDPSFLGLTAIPKQNVKIYKGKKKLSEYFQHSCFIVNGKLAHELDIKFPTERNKCDDWPFSYYGFMKGANTYKLNFLAARTSPQKEKRGSTFTDSHREMLFINDFLEFSDFFYLFLNKDGNLTGDPAFPFSMSSKLINTFKIPKTQLQKDLYELCKTKDVQAVKDFLKAHGSTSMDFNPKEIINKIKSNGELTEW